MILALPAIGQAGSVIEDLKISASTPGLPFTLGFNERFGASVAGFGDLNGDGTLELMVGSPQHDQGGKDKGMVRILSLRPDGTILASVEIAEGLNGFVGPLETGDLFGTSIACAGDLDGDGIPEFAIGASGDSDGGSTKTGAVHILFLNANGSVRAQQEISVTAGGFTGNLLPLDQFGASLTSLGDLDQDGVPDLAVGAPSNSISGFGAVWILLMNADGTVKSNTALDEQTPALAGFVNSGNAFGSSVACPGDLDGNGWPDLFIGVPRDNAISSADGRIVTVFLNGPSSVLSATSFSLKGVVFAVDAGGAEFGTSLGWLGDLDGNGTTELAVASSLDTSNAEVDATEVWIVSVGANGAATSFVSIDPQENGVSTRVSSIDSFGSAVHSLGDLDGDGVSDLVVGAEIDVVDGPAAGAVFLMRLSDGDPDAKFIPSTTSGCTPLAINFADASSGAGLSSWDWDFGDGNGSSLQNPSHTYTLAGSYTVTLAVSGAGGEARRIAKDLIVVSDLPVADFYASATLGAAPLSVNFTDRSPVGVNFWLWNFGDGVGSIERNPTHVFASPGTYTVALTITCTVGGDSEVRAAYVRVVGQGQAAVHSNNGRELNSDVLTSLSDPILGTTWTGEVDTSQIPGGSGPVTLLGFTEAFPAGTLTQFGELLVDFSSALVILDRQVPVNSVTTHAVTIPNDTSLLGIPVSAQGFVSPQSLGGSSLSNRLDFLLGQ